MICIDTCQWRNEYLELLLNNDIEYIAKDHGGYVKNGKVFGGLWDKDFTAAIQKLKW